MNGLAITIIVGQLPKLFGFSTDADGFMDEVKAFLDGLDQTNTTALALGRGTLAACCSPAVLAKDPRGARRGRRRDRGHRAFDLAAKGVDVVGALPQGLRHHVPLGAARELWARLLAASFGIVLVSLTDTIATSTSFAARRGDDVNPTRR